METEGAKKNGGSFKPVLIAVGILVVLALVGYVWMTTMHSREVKQLKAECGQQVEDIRAAATDLASALAADIALVLGATVADDVARLEHAMLESQLAAVVRGKKIAGVVVMDPRGAVLAATDQRYAGRTLDDRASLDAMAVSQVTIMPAVPVSGQVEAAAPLFVGSKRVGTLRVFVELDQFAPTAN